MAKITYQDLGEPTEVSAQGIGKAIIVPAKEALRQVRFALQGNLTIRDNSYAAIVTLGYTGNSTQTLTNGTEYTFQNPLKTMPIGFTPIKCVDSNGTALAIPPCSFNTSRTDGLLGITATIASSSTGYVGEIAGPISRASSVSVVLTSGNAVDIGTTTSLTLTGGRWLVSGSVGFTAAGATNITKLVVAVSRTSASLTGTDAIAVPSQIGDFEMIYSFAGEVPGAGNQITMPVPAYPVTVTAGTTMQLFLVARGTFTVAGLNAYGSMRAERISVVGNGQTGIVTGILWGG